MLSGVSSITGASIWLSVAAGAVTGAITVEPSATTVSRIRGKMNARKSAVIKLPVNGCRKGIKQ